jgi:hypothetical protein
MTTSLTRELCETFDETAIDFLLEELLYTNEGRLSNSFPKGSGISKIVCAVFTPKLLPNGLRIKSLPGKKYRFLSWCRVLPLEGLSIPVNRGKTSIEKGFEIPGRDDITFPNNDNRLTNKNNTLKTKNNKLTNNDNKLTKTRNKMIRRSETWKLIQNNSRNC